MELKRIQSLKNILWRRKLQKRTSLPHKLAVIRNNVAGPDRCMAFVQITKTFLRLTEYAKANGIKLTEFLPEYAKYGRAAPLKRNLLIIKRADLVLAFWDGVSRGTKYAIDRCKERGVPVTVYTAENTHSLTTR